MGWHYEYSIQIRLLSQLTWFDQLAAAPAMLSLLVVMHIRSPRLGLLRQLVEWVLLKALCGTLKTKLNKQTNKTQNQTNQTGAWF